MQIILPESDINQALENFARSILVIQAGMKVTIDLKAGRGENGFTATLEITPEGQATPLVQPKVEAPKSEPVTRAPKVATPIIEDKQPVAPVDEVVNTPVDTAIATDGDAQLGEPAPVDEPKGKSLFAGIKKPVNS